MALPQISLSALQNPTPTTLSALSTACTTTGFFHLTDAVPRSRQQHLLSLVRTFFLSASPEEKSALARRPPDAARGYQRLHENVTQGTRDAHEAVDFYRAWQAGEFARQGVGDGVLGGENAWPRTPEELERELQTYVEEVLEVGRVLVRAMGRALGGESEETFARETSDSFWVMRIIGYPPVEGEVGCGEHTDYGCVTLLLTDDTRGALQVRCKDGTWIDVDPIEGAYVVNIGDMMELWTNGLWRSTLHRVIHKGSNYRVSLPFFFEPNFDARIKPLESCVKQTGGKPIGEEVKYGDHLLSKIRGNFY